MVKQEPVPGKFNKQENQAGMDHALQPRMEHLLEC
jgi:hypothetical protein